MPASRLFDAGEAEIADDRVGLGVDRLDRQRIGHGIEAARMRAPARRDGCFRRRSAPGNRLVIWNERPMPARAISSGVCPAIGWPISDTAPCIRRVHAGQQIERGGLAGAVGADQRVQRAVGDGDIDALHRPDAAEALDDVAGREHRALDVRLRPQEFRQRQHLDRAAPTSRHLRWSSCGTARSAARRRRPGRSAKTR